MWILIVVGIIVAIVWAIASSARNRDVVRHVEQNEVNARDGLAHLLTAEMRGWEATTLGGPVADEVGPPQCLDRGTRWVLERARMAPELAQMIAKAAYTPLLHEKLDRRLGTFVFGAWLLKEDEKEKELERRSGQREGIDKWWGDVDYRFDLLYEKASECGALDREFVRALYGKTPRQLTGKTATVAAPSPAAAPPGGELTLPCPTCRTLNRSGAKFCRSCARGLADAVCAKCGQSKLPRSTFCDNCGARFNGQVAARGRGKPLSFDAAVAEVEKEIEAAAPPVVRLRECPNCGEANRGDAYKCANCGMVIGAQKPASTTPNAAATAPKTCANCSTISSGRATRCPGCGYGLR